MTEHLVYHNGHHYIARPGVMTDHSMECPDCRGLGMRSGARKVCPTCSGTGRVKAAPDERQLRLCWVNITNDAFICWDYDEADVRVLPIETIFNKS